LPRRATVTDTEDRRARVEPLRFAVLALSKLSANDLVMLRRFYDELAQLDELHQELISNPEKDIK
jgi:hypothetical protein